MIEMTKEIKEYAGFRRKLTILNYARDIGSNIEAIRTFKISRSTFYKWKKAFDKDGPQGLLKKRPIANTHPNKIKPDVMEKVLELRKEYQLGSWRIKWYLERYHGIVISESNVYRILKKHKVERLHKHASRRTVHTKRYSKLVPGHHIQVDVKFLNFKSNSGEPSDAFNTPPLMMQHGFVRLKYTNAIPRPMPFVLGNCVFHPWVFIFKVIDC